MLDRLITQTKHIVYAKIDMILYKMTIEDKTIFVVLTFVYCLHLLSVHDAKRGATKSKVLC